MLMDEQVDHGQIITRQELEFSKLKAEQLEEKLAELGGQMLVNAIPKWINGEIKPREQDHSQATFTKKITKEDGFVDLEKDNPEMIYRKFLAFQPWPGIYYFVQKNDRKIRVIITGMKFQNGRFLIKKVKAESKNEMEYEKFTRL